MLLNLLKHMYTLTRNNNRNKVNNTGNLISNHLVYQEVTGLPNWREKLTLYPEIFTEVFR